MDKRSKRTVEAIRNAFKQMICESDVSDITVKEIASRAGCNRKTFYLHYECIEELYAEMEESLSDQFIKCLEKNGFFSEELSIRIFISSLSEFITSDFMLYRKLLVDTGYRFIFRAIKQRVKKHLTPLVNMNEHSMLKLDMGVDYVGAGLMKLFAVWLDHINEISQQELCDLAHDLIRVGFGGYVASLRI